MSNKNHNLLAAGGWLLLSLGLAWMTIDHATGADLSELEESGPTYRGKFERVRRGIYKLVGRPGIVAFDLGFLAIGVLAFTSSLKKFLAKEEPRPQVSLTAPDGEIPSDKPPACAVCKLWIRGTVEKRTTENERAEDTIAYLCSSCATPVCVICAERQLKQGLWDGWKECPCPACGEPFNCDSVVRKT